MFPMNFPQPMQAAREASMMTSQPQGPYGGAMVPTVQPPRVQQAGPTSPYPGMTVQRPQPQVNPFIQGIMQGKKWYEMGLPGGGFMMRPAQPGNALAPAQPQQMPAVPGGYSQNALSRGWRG